MRSCVWRFFINGWGELDKPLSICKNLPPNVLCSHHLWKKSVREGKRVHVEGPRREEALRWILLTRDSSKLQISLTAWHDPTPTGWLQNEDRISVDSIKLPRNITENKGKSANLAPALPLKGVLLQPNQPPLTQNQAPDDDTRLKIRRKSAHHLFKHEKLKWIQANPQIPKMPSGRNVIIIH